MRGSHLLVVVLVASCGAPTRPNAPRVRMTPKDIVQQSSNAIVRIEANGDGEGDNVGTGFILDKSGLIATNLHVVAGKRAIKVKLHDGSDYQVTHVAGVDPGRDLAVLRIAPNRPLTSVRLGDSDQMSAGDQVIAIGNPLGVFDYSVSSGLVSQVRSVCSQAQADHDRKVIESLVAKPTRSPQDEKELEKVRCLQELKLLQISAPISQGSSGGPLFNQFGEVVGVTTAIITEGQNINLAVPGNYLKPIVSQPAAIPLDKFAEVTKREAPKTVGGDGPKITRNVPEHPIKVLEGCSDTQVSEVIDAITSAIDVGAPLYNRGDIEACFRIYEGTSNKLERDPPCAGVGKAFGEGLLRASTLPTFKEKAWALRDTFDGLIDVAMRRGIKPGQKPTKK
jgi:S1-C subfamily serine protease